MIIRAGATRSHLERHESIQHNFFVILADTRRDRFDKTDNKGLCMSYKADAAVKRRNVFDFSFLHGVISGKIESSLPPNQFSVRVPVRETT